MYSLMITFKNTDDAHFTNWYTNTAAPQLEITKSSYHDDREGCSSGRSGLEASASQACQSIPLQTLKFEEWLDYDLKCLLKRMFWKLNSKLCITVTAVYKYVFEK